MNRAELYKNRSRKFFDRVAHEKYGSSPYLDKAVLSITQFEPGDVVLDIGCGQGRFLEKVCRENDMVSCYGIDLSREMIRIAVENAPVNCHFIVGESDSLPYQEGSFSKIFCMNAFHHFPEPEKSLREISRVVKDSGVVIIGDIWLPPLLREAVNVFLPVARTGDYRVYSRKELEILFGSHSLKMSDYFYVHPFLFVAKFKR